MASDTVDKAGPMRKGEELDVPALQAYLRRALPDVEGTVTIEQFAGGHSNLTYLVHVGDNEFVMRRPPFGTKVKGAHDMGREYRVLSRLHGVYAPAPRPALYCEDESILGAKFYLMERLRGVILRVQAPDGFDPSRELVRNMCSSFVNNLADLHAIDYEKVGLGDLRKPGQYMARQMDGWERRYAGSQTDDIPEFDESVAWLKEGVPEDSDATLIHNDYKFDNLVLDEKDWSHIVGVLDWEMCTIGDPLSDLAISLAYWVNRGEDNPFIAAQGLVQHREGSMSRAELAEAYAERSGRDVSKLHWYFVYAQMKNVVILQQIYYRYKHGHTKDERFAIFIEIAKLAAKRTVAAIDAGTI